MKVSRQFVTTVKWPIKQFSIAAPRSDSTIKFKTDDFKLSNDVNVYLHFSPTSTMPNADKNYCSLYLVGRELAGKTVNLSVRLWIENKEGDEIESDKEVITDQLKKALGWSEFVKTEKLYDPNFLKDDVIYICCDVQFPQDSPQDNIPKIDEALKKRDEATMKELAFCEQGFGGQCIIQVGEQEIPISKSKLMAASDFFASMFQSETQDSPVDKINMQDSSVETVKAFIRYVHVYKLENLEEVASGLYLLAKEYGLDDLKKKCSQILTDGLTPENVLQSLIMAFKSNDEALQQVIFVYLDSLPPEQNFRHIMKSDEWVDLSLQNVDLLRQILTAILDNVKVSR